MERPKATVWGRRADKPTAIKKPRHLPASCMRDTPHDDDQGSGVEPRPFTVVLAPTATVAVQTQQQQDACGSGILVRHLCAQRPPPGHEGAGSRSQQASFRLSAVIVGVRAQPRALHVFRGRKLCRVVQFPSPVTDFASFPWGSSAGAASTDILCVATCRNGAVYALPAAEVLENAERKGQAVKRPAGKPVDHPTPPSVGGGGSGSGGGSAGGKPSGAGEQKQHGSRSSSASEAVGIFDELAPTLLKQSRESLSGEQAPTSQSKGGDIKRKGGSGGGAGSGDPPFSVVGGVSVGGLAMKARERWAAFAHSGARTVATCSDGTTTAVAGIVDRAAAYGIAVDSPTAAGRHLGILGGVDGAVPTTSCVVWMEGGGQAGSTLGDGKGFSLPAPVFRSLFGGGLSGVGAAPAPSPAKPPSDSAAGGDVVAVLVPGTPLTISVVLVGDATGTVRWAPVPPRPGVSGGVLASFRGERTAIVATLPQLDAESRAVGVLLVGANGSVLNLAAGPPVGAERRRGGVSRKRRRPEDAEANGLRRGSGSKGAGVGDGGGAGNGSSSTELRAGPVDPHSPPVSTRRRRFRLPFPVAAACSAPGFLVHCHAGALFATAVPASAEVDEWSQAPRGGPGREARLGPHGTAAAPVHSLRPVRLPLPCDTVGVAVAPVLPADGEKAGATSPDGNSTASVLRTLVLSLSARGRLVGFMAPRSAEELEGWSLDTGKGGVRVGGSAGVERRVRCQLERLSSLGRQCAALSAESAERDREIRVLRGATVLLPPLAANVSKQRRDGAVSGGVTPSPGSLRHSVSMIPDTKEGPSGFGGPHAGGEEMTGRADTLQVRLCVRLWPREGGRAREELQALGGEGGGGRWFVVTRIVAEGADGSGGGGAERAGEGWAWSTSAPVPVTSLRQGWPWSSSVGLALPSARPVTVTSWLQFRFGTEGDGGAGGGDAWNPHDDASGVCVELGSSRFDLFDWGVKLPSVPRSTAAIRAASVGRGSSFCGPELAIADVFHGVGERGGGGGGGGGGGSGLGGYTSDRTARLKVPVTWSSFRLRVASPDRDAGALLALLVPPTTPIPPPPDRNGGAGGGGSNSSRDLAEIAIRVAGQVAILRAIGGASTGPARGGAGVAGGGPGRAGEAAGSGEVEVAVTCSHAAMAPLVREALLCRSRALLRAPPRDGRGGESDVAGNGDGRKRGLSDGGVVARGDAAARLLRDVYPIGQSLVDASDEARAMGAARARDGPSADSARESLMLMYKVGEIYQSLRRQQESVGAAL